MKKQYKSSKPKNNKIKKKIEGAPLKSYVAPQVIFRFCSRNKIEHCGKIKLLMTLKFHNITNK